MRFKKGWAATAAAAGLAGAILSVGGGAVQASDGIKVHLHDQSGSQIGVVKLEQEGGKVAVRAVVNGLVPGFHGFHMHSVGACSGNFGSAGPHFNPTGATHGSHAGDFPNLLVNSDGTAELRFTTDKFSLASLQDADGSALIVHQSPDNHAHVPSTDAISGGSYTRRAYYWDSDPSPDTSAWIAGAAFDTTLRTGDAGARQACGAIPGTGS